MALNSPDSCRSKTAVGHTVSRRFRPAPGCLAARRLHSLRAIRASKKAPGCDHIYSAGEKEYLVWQQRKDSGVPINEAVQKEMSKVRDEYGLTKYVFPWEK